MLSRVWFTGRRLLKQRRYRPSRFMLLLTTSRTPSSALPAAAELASASVAGVPSARARSRRCCAACVLSTLRGQLFVLRATVSPPVPAALVAVLELAIFVSATQPPVCSRPVSLSPRSAVTTRWACTCGRERNRRAASSPGSAPAFPAVFWDSCQSISISSVSARESRCARYSATRTF